MARWTKKAPTEPGRYWWRSTKGGEHGITLVILRAPYPGESAPRLVFRSVIHFEDEQRAAWSYGGFSMYEEHVNDAVMKKLGIEVWSEPMKVPAGFDRLKERELIR